MDRHFRPNFQRIQHPLLRILSSRSEVIVHALSFRFRSLQMQCRQQIVIDFYYFHLFNLDVKAHTPFAPPQMPQRSLHPIVRLSRQPIQ